MNNHMDNRPDGNRPNRNNPGNQGPNKNRQSILAFLICLLISLVCLSFVTGSGKGGYASVRSTDRRTKDPEIILSECKL